MTPESCACARCANPLATSDLAICTGCGAPYHAACLALAGCQKLACEGHRVAPPPTARRSPIERLAIVALAFTFPLALMHELGMIFGAMPRVAGLIATPLLLALLARLSLITTREVFAASVVRRSGWLAIGTWAVGVSLRAQGLEFALRDALYLVGLQWEAAALALFGCGACLNLVGRDLERRSLGLGSVMVLCVAIVTGIAVPNFRAQRERANTRACFANQKTIIGAVEMFQLDRNKKISELAPYLHELKSGGYLRSTPTDPGQGVNTEEHYQLTDGGLGILCTVHGPVHAGR